MEYDTHTKFGQFKKKQKKLSFCKIKSIDSRYIIEESKEQQKQKALQKIQKDNRIIIAIII